MLNGVVLEVWVPAMGLGFFNKHNSEQCTAVEYPVAFSGAACVLLVAEPPLAE